MRPETLSPSATRFPYRLHLSRVALIILGAALGGLACVPPAPMEKAQPWLAPLGLAAMTLGLFRRRVFRRSRPEERTERSRAEKRLEQLSACFLTLNVPPEENIHRLTALCGELLGATCALYHRLEEGRLFVAGQWNTPPGFAPTERPDGHICYDVIRQASGPRVVGDLLQSGYAATDPTVRSCRMRTYLGCPVRCGDTVIGSVCAVYQHDCLPGPEDRNLIALVAAALGAEEERRRAKEALRAAQEQMETRVQARTAELADANTALQGEINERMAAEMLLRYRVHFENLINTISTNFINLTADRIDEGIHQALQAVGEFAGVDRSYIFLFSPDGARMTNTHEWCSRETPPRKTALQEVDADTLPWLLASLRRFESVFIPRVSALPAEAVREREHLKAQSIQSTILIPMVYKRALVGFVGFDAIREETDWSEEIVALLKMVGDIFVNALERERAEDMIRWQAYHDGLTDLPNRAYFQDRLGQALSVAGRKEESTAVLLLDLDRFKHVNDSLGHDAGDQLLREIARRLTGAFPHGEIVARMGGDEFAVLLPGIKAPQDAVRVAQEIAQLLLRPVAVEGHELFVTANIGISLFPFDGTDAQTLLKHADVALYRAKGQGLGGYQLYTQTMNATAFERLVLETSLRKAIERDELILHYQPQVALTTGQIIGVEALVRWRHPELGLIPPAQFVPLAEETGLIDGLGAWVIQEACRQAAAWEAAGQPLRVAVNLSPRQFGQCGLAGIVSDALTRSGLDPHLLDLELTESTLVDNGAAAVDLLKELKRLGVCLSVDDFGTGYSSLSYLRRLPVDVLKVDRSFVMQVAEDATDQAVVRAVIDLAHALNLIVIAEGVETEAQRNCLREMGCDAMQGYLFSEPRPAADIELLLRAHSAASPLRLHLVAGRSNGVSSPWLPSRLSDQKDIPA